MSKRKRVGARNDLCGTPALIEQTKYECRMTVNAISLLDRELGI